MTNLQKDAFGLWMDIGEGHILRPASSYSRFSEGQRIYFTRSAGSPLYAMNASKSKSASATCEEIWINSSKIGDIDFDSDFRFYQCSVALLKRADPDFDARHATQNAKNLKAKRLYYLSTIGFMDGVVALTPQLIQEAEAILGYSKESALEKAAITAALDQSLASPEDPRGDSTFADQGTQKSKKSKAL